MRFLDCGDGFMGTYVSKFIKLHTIHMCNLCTLNKPQRSCVCGGGGTLSGYLS